MLDVPNAVRAVRAAASSKRVPAPWAPPVVTQAFQVAPSRVSGRLQVSAQDLAFAELMPSSTGFVTGQRTAALLRLVAQANAFEELLSELEKLVGEVERANAWRATWNKPAIIPNATVMRSRARAVGIRRLVDQVAPHVR